MACDKPEQNPIKMPYETPKLIYVGQVQEMVLAGVGKLSILGGDAGDPRKDVVSG
jgi:hypothetical protein